MFGVEEQTAERSLRSVVRQLGPELESHTATPTQSYLKQRLFSESSQLEAELQMAGAPGKLVKEEHSVFETPMGSRLAMFGEFSSEMRMPSSIRNKENVRPMLMQSQVPQFQLPLKKSRKSRAMVESLSPEEGQKLLEAWEKNHFINFNSWLQVAKAKVPPLSDPPSFQPPSAKRSTKRPLSQTRPSSPATTNAISSSPSLREVIQVLPPTGWGSPRKRPKRWQSSK